MTHIAKLSFFEYVAKTKKKKRIFIINKNDKEGELFAHAIRHNYANLIYWFSKEDFLRKISDYVDITSDKARAKFNEWIFADFNLENAAAATTFSEMQNISFDIVQRALANCRGVAGRLEVVQRKPFSVIVDYAHTPDSLEKVYTVARKDYCVEPTSALIAILGSAGGGRDKWKRAEMGIIAGKQCNEIIITNEDPFDEDPKEIMNEVKKGVLQAGFLEQNLKMILDRREAIRYALKQAKKGDVVIATGKGSEEWIRWEKGRKEAWNERKVFEEELKKI
jgi:UDP-N-acetylmuramoyl-L-alanyl-D-glutamate--2,6-diaminopimelate ligase